MISSSVSNICHFFNFNFGFQAEKFPLHFDEYSEFSSTAGDSLSNHNNKRFTTHDNDNDDWEGGNCALNSGTLSGKSGGWWFNACEECNLNGLNYGPSATVERHTGIHWNKFGSDGISLKSAQMAIRPLV